MAVGNIKECCECISYCVRTIERNPQSGVEELGSGILVWHGSRLYLLTAGHCYPTGSIANLTVEVKNSDGIFTPVVLKNQLAFYNESVKVADWDFSIVEVDANLIALPAEKIIIGKRRSESGMTEKYFSYGYPGYDRDGLTWIFYPDVDERIWYIRDESVNKSYKITGIISGFSGAGIIDIYEGKYVCVGTVKGFKENLARMYRINVTPASVYLACLPALIDDPNPPTAYEEPEEYFQRYCQRVGTLAIDHRLWDIPRTTLVEYIDGKDDSFTSSNVLLVGAAQTGKSYEMKKLAADLSARGDKVKLVELKDCKDIDQLPKELPNGGFLLLDGLDEVRQSEMSSIAERILAITRNNPALRLIVSCRENFADYLKDEKFGVLMLENFSREDRRDYLKHRGLESEDIYSQLMQPDTEDLSTNPFNINCILEIGMKDDGSFALPGSLVEIYERYVGKLFRVDEQKKDPNEDTNREKCTRLLKKMAYAMVVGDRQELSEEEVLCIIGGHENLDLILRNAVVKCFDKSYSFTTNGIREYLAASRMCEDTLAVFKGKVCLPGSDIIRPKLVNVVRWWLNHKSSEGNISEDIIEWLSKDGNDTTLLLSCRRQSIPESRRLAIVRNLLEGCKDQGKFYALYYTGGFQKLVDFAFSPSFVEYLEDELKHVDDAGAHLYNLLSMAGALPWNDLGEAETTSLRAILLSLIDRFEDWESGFSLFYWIISNEKLYRDEALVEEVVNKAGKSQNHEVCSALCVIIAKGEYADKYKDFLMDAEKIIVDQGTLMVTRDALYSALGSLKEEKNIKDVLNQIADGRIAQRNNHGDKDYKEMVKSLLISILDCHGGEAEYKTLFSRIFPKDYHYDYHKNPLLMAFDEVNEERGIEDESFLQKTYALLHPFERSKEQEEEYKTRVQEEFDILNNYEEFKKKVLDVVETCKSNGWNLSTAVQNGMDLGRYVIDFITYFSKWPSLDAENIRCSIENRSAYDLFRFKQLTNEYTNSKSVVKLSENDKAFIKQQGVGILEDVARNGERINYLYVQSALKLLVQGEISVGPEVLKGLTGYSFESFYTSEDKEKSVGELIEEKVEKNELIGLYWEAVNSGKAAHTVNFKMYLTFLMKNGTPDIKNSLYERMTADASSGEAYYILDLFLNLPEFSERFKDDFDNFTPYDQLRIFESMGKELLPQMEEAMLTYPDKVRQTAVRKLLSFGSQKALEYCVGHPEEDSLMEQWYMFSYSDSSALSMLVELLKRYLGKGNEYVSVWRSIETSLGNIASQSEELCDEVVERISDNFGDNPTYCSQLTNYCRRRRLEVRADKYDEDELFQQFGL